MMMKLNTPIILFFALAFCSCSEAQDSIENVFFEEEILLPALTDTEKKALDALDVIQVSGWQLYSTFPNQEHDCVEYINTYTITKDEFEDALLELLNQFYEKIPAVKRINLASTAAQAQEEYVLESCGEVSDTLNNSDPGTPNKRGTWIFKSLLEERDLIIKW